MKIEEAIVEFEKQLHSAMVVLESGFGTNLGENNRIYLKRKEMAEIALSALRAQQAREIIWHKFPEEKPTVSKEYYVVSRCCNPKTKGAKVGDIHVYIDYWYNESESAWYGWEVCDQGNPYWNILYWGELDKEHISLPDDLPGRVTSVFCEEGSQEG